MPYHDVEVDFTGEYSTLIVIQKDKPGVVTYITKCLSDQDVNIAFMRLFRESKGNTAYSIVESDGPLPENIAEGLGKAQMSQCYDHSAVERRLKYYGF